MAIHLEHTYYAMYIRFYKSLHRYCTDFVQGHITIFRDAVLGQKPLLLSTLLAKAIESGSGFEKVCPHSPCLLVGCEVLIKL